MRRFVVNAAALAASSALILSASAAQAQCVIVKSSSDRVINPAPCQARPQALLVTRDRPASPAFVVTTPVASRGSVVDRREPGPGYYGVSDCTQARIYVRIHNAPVRELRQRYAAVDPFQQIPAHLPMRQRYQQAQEHWLYSQGLVQRARLIQRVAAPAHQNCSAETCVDACVESKSQAPKAEVERTPAPRATIKLTPGARFGGDQRV